MKPITTVIIINLSLLLIFFLFSNYLVHALHVMPIFTTALAILNIVAGGLGYLDRKKEFVVAFSAGFLIAAGAAAISWYYFVTNSDEIRKVLTA